LLTIRKTASIGPFEPQMAAELAALSVAFYPDA
jgi:hypothetical protein